MLERIEQKAHLLILLRLLDEILYHVVEKRIIEALWLKLRNSL